MAVSGIHWVADITSKLGFMGEFFLFFKDKGGTELSIKQQVNLREFFVLLETCVL